MAKYITRAQFGKLMHTQLFDNEKCDRKWDAELNCAPCEACVYRWLKKERRDEH